VLKIIWRVLSLQGNERDGLALALRMRQAETHWGVAKYIASDKPRE
jgi:hypothetical protein